MSVPSTVVISAAVEGRLDEEILRRLLESVGAAPGRFYGGRGKAHLRQQIDGYNQAARHSPWVVLVDLDQEAECAPPLRRDWLPTAAPKMCFRVAVRAVEAWLLADRDRIAAFLGVRPARIHTEPETIGHPKRAVVELARQSRRKDIRQDMVPRPRSGRAVGPAYTSRLVEFVSREKLGWRPGVAARSCDSLRRCLACLRSLARH